MTKNFLSRFAVIVFCTFILQFAGFLVQPALADVQQLPNIIIIEADDLGTGDICYNNLSGPGCERYKCGPNAAPGCTTALCNTPPDTAYQSTNCVSDPDDLYSRRGKSKTPALDSLAKSGITLTNFYTPSPLCTPSRAALMTGRHPLRTKVTYNQSKDDYLSNTEKSLATILKNQGYETAIVGKWNLGSHVDREPHPISQSWDHGFEYNYVLPLGVHYDNSGFCFRELLKQEQATTILNGNDWTYVTTHEYGALSQMDPIFMVCPANSKQIDFWVDKTTLKSFRGDTKQSLSKILTGKAKDYILDASDELRPNKTTKPFFLFLAYPTPHTPIDIHLPGGPVDWHIIGTSADVWDDNDNVNADNVKDYCMSDCQNTFKNDKYPAFGNTTKDYRNCVAECETDLGYHYAIAELDTQIAELLNYLDNTADPRDINYATDPHKSKRLGENTIVVFVSDNGPFMGDADEYNDRGSTSIYKDGDKVTLRGAKKFTYEGGVRVPFIARWTDHWPIKGSSNAVQPGAKLGQPADMMDLFATLIKEAGVAITPNSDTTNKINVMGADIMIDGKLLSNVLRNVDGNGNILTGTAKASQQKDIQIYWQGNYAICRRASNDSLCQRESVQGYTNMGHPTSYLPSYSHAIMSFNPSLTSLNGYKLFLDDNDLLPTELYNLTSQTDNCASDSGEEELNNLYNKAECSSIQNSLKEKGLKIQNIPNIPYYYYLPSIKDNSIIGWENYLTVMAKEPIKMNAKLRVYDMSGTLKGTYIYSDTDGAANAPAIAANARVAQRPSWIAGSVTSPVPVEGSMIIETSVPSIVNTNTITNYGTGFDIYEAPKARSKHVFTQAWDGPNQYQAYILIQNIYTTPTNVTIKLIPKDVSSNNCGLNIEKTFDIGPFQTKQIRPADLDANCKFNGTVEVYSNAVAPSDGLGLPVPVVNRYENGNKDLAIYESAELQPALNFPHMKDGKFGGTLDYQNFLSIMNPSSSKEASVTIVLFNNDGVEEGRLTNEIIPAGGKKTWRPSWIKGTQSAPLDLEGSIVVTTDIPVVGQTNAMYNSTANDALSADTLAIYESAKPASTLNFPKAFDNRCNDPNNDCICQTGEICPGRIVLYDNYVYIQNPDGAVKNIKIELFNNNGAANGTPTFELASHATYVFRPKDLVTDGTGNFRGSVKVTETSGKNITGVLKYEVHKTISYSSEIGAITIFGPMGE